MEQRCRVERVGSSDRKPFDPRDARRRFARATVCRVSLINDADAAGLAEMAFAKFTVFTIIGCAVWCTALSLLGYSLGGTYDHVQKSFSYASYVIAVVAIAVVAFLIWHRFRTMRAERR